MLGLYVRHGRRRILALAVLAACGDDGSNPFDSATPTTSGSTTAPEETVGLTGTGVADTTAGGTTERPTIFDLVQTSSARSTCSMGPPAASTSRSPPP